MRITICINAGLTFIDCLNVLVHDLLTVLENISTGFAIFVHGFVAELCQERVRFDNFRMLFLSVESDMEKSDCAACIDGVLLHVKNIRRNIFWLQSLCLFLFELVLSWALFVEHHDSQDRFGNHLETPLFKREQLLEVKQISLESHFSNELVYDFWVAFKGHPILFSSSLTLHI